MTRLFLEIKNITLCAEPSFFILSYFLCKNLLFLCAEHHYPSAMCCLWWRCPNWSGRPSWPRCLLIVRRRSPARAAERWGTLSWCTRRRRGWSSRRWRRPRILGPGRCRRSRVGAAAWRRTRRRCAAWASSGRWRHSRATFLWAARGFPFLIEMSQN